MPTSANLFLNCCVSLRIPDHMFNLFFTISFAIFYHGGQYLDTTVVINRYRTPHLIKISQVFLVFRKCGVAPCCLSKCINFKNMLIFLAFKWLLNYL